MRSLHSNHSADAAGAAACQTLNRAVALLEAASSDWRHRGPSDGTVPLHWPVAIGAARAHIAFAMAELGDARVLDAMRARMRERSALASRQS